MAAATFYLESKPNKDGTHSVRIRITRNRKKAYYNTGIKLKVDPNPRKSEWNASPDYRKDNWITPRHPRHETLNAELRLALDGLSLISKEHPSFTAVQIKEKYEQPTEETTGVIPAPRGLLAYIEERIARKRKMKQFAAADNLYYAAEKLRAYAIGKSDHEILTAAFLTDFAAHLSTTCAPSTAKLYVTYLAGAYQKGVLSGMVDQMGDPFEDIQISAPRLKQPRPVSQQLLDLYNLPLERKAWDDARNTVILLFLLHGARVSEGVSLEWDKHVTKEYISYLPRKRGAKEKHVPRSKMINQILSHYPRRGRYVLPYLSDADSGKSEEEMYMLFKAITGRINTALRRMTKQYKLPHLSTHMARRTFTDKALEELQDLREVQLLVGHASILTTEHYADEVKKSKLLEASRKTFGSMELQRGTPGEQEQQSDTNHTSAH